jgi:inhibitor of KinA sporulation pathway (predicted exonuclease)
MGPSNGERSTDMPDINAPTPVFDRVRSLAEGGAAYVAIFDTEYTSWEGAMARRWSGPNEYREIVQIGAVKLALSDGMAEVAAFDVLTHPVFNPDLSGYFTALTGITNQALAARGTSYADGLAAFAAFTADCALILSNGADDGHLRQNCGWRSVAWPFAEGVFDDLRPDFAATLGRPLSETISCDLPRLFGLPFDGPTHDGLADARAIAVALRHVLG